MNWNELMADLTAVNEIISDWRQGFAVPEIDKDIVVEKLRGIYCTVKSIPVSEAVESPISSDGNVFIGSEGQLLSDDNPALGTGDDEPDVERHWPEEAVEPAPRNIAAEHVSHIMEGSVAESTADKPSRRDVLKSLYDDEPAPGQRELSSAGAEMVREGMELDYQPQDNAPATPEPGANIGGMPRIAYDEMQGKTVIGDVLGTSTRTLGDAYASAAGDDVASRVVSAGAGSLRANLGVNDGFQLAHDLFNGDTAAFEAAIDKLDEFTDLDDAMVYIYENFAWSPDSESVQRMVDLLTQKLG